MGCDGVVGAEFSDGYEGVGEGVISLDACIGAFQRLREFSDYERRLNVSMQVPLRRVGRATGATDIGRMIADGFPRSVSE